MPMVWIEPTVFTTVDGRQVYHLYKDNHPMQWWFTTEASQDDAEGDYDYPDYRFDLRQVPLPSPMRKMSRVEQIHYAIEHGYLTFPDRDPELKGNERYAE